MIYLMTAEQKKSFETISTCCFDLYGEYVGSFFREEHHQRVHVYINSSIQSESIPHQAEFERGWAFLLLIFSVHNPK